MSGTQQPVANGGSRVTLPSTNAWARPLQHAAAGTTASSSRTTAATVVAKRPTSSSKQQQEVLPNGSGVVLRERFLHLISSLIGQRVVLTKTNGTQLEGILHTFTPFKEESSSLPPEHRNLYVLRATKLLFTHPNNGDDFAEGSTVLVPAHKVHTVHVTGVPLLLTPTSSSSVTKDTEQPQQQLPTDTDISSSLSSLTLNHNNKAAAEKTLVAAGSAWTTAAQRETTAASNTSKRTAAAAAAATSTALPWRPQRTTPPSSLGGYASAVKANPTTSTRTSSEGVVTSLSGSIGGWDQFQANERLFNVKATFDENQYTTALDKSDIPSHLQHKAERMAREIEGQTSDNVHIMEERGQCPVSDDLDEEDKYSGVLRASTLPQDKPQSQPDEEEEPLLQKNDYAADESKEESKDTTATDSSGVVKSSSDQSPSTEAEGDKDISAAINESETEKPLPPASKLNPSAKEFSFNPAAKSFTPSSTTTSMEASSSPPYYEPSSADTVPPQQQQFLPHHHYIHPSHLVPTGFYGSYRPPPPLPGATGLYNPMGGQQMPQMVSTGNPYGVYRGPMQPGMIPAPAPPPFYPGNYHGHNVMYGGVGGAMQQPGGSSGRMIEGEDGAYRGRGVGRGMMRGGRRNNGRNNNNNKGRMPGRGGPYPTMNYSTAQDDEASGVAMNYYDGNPVDPSFGQPQVEFEQEEQNDRNVTESETTSEVPSGQANET